MIKICVYLIFFYFWHDNCLYNNCRKWIIEWFLNPAFILWGNRKKVPTDVLTTHLNKGKIKYQTSKYKGI